MKSRQDKLWRDIRAEAHEALAEEPVLASYFHAAVLSHESLESALVFNLARMLDHGVMTSLTLSQVFAHTMAEDPEIARHMRRDLVAYRERDPACDRYLMPLLYFKGFHALQAHRIAHRLWAGGRRALARFLQSQVSDIFGVDIHPGATIGGGIMLDHATGVVIGETAVVGDDVSMLHAVTLGGSGTGTGDRHPKIGRGVLIAAGAKILGNIEVGEGAKIGAGSLVVTPVPAHSTVVGVPARVVGKPLEVIPALEMDQQINFNGDNGNGESE